MPSDDTIPAAPAADGYIDPNEATAKLALELASRLSPVHVVAQRYGLSVDQIRTLLATPEFAAMVRGARAQWAADGNLVARVRAKATMALEQAILPVHGIVHDRTALNSSRIDATKLLATIAGLARGDGAALPGENGPQFSIEINLGDPAKNVVISGSTSQPQVADGVSND